MTFPTARTIVNRKKKNGRERNYDCIYITLAFFTTCPKLNENDESEKFNSRRKFHLTNESKLTLKSNKKKIFERNFKI